MTGSEPISALSTAVRFVLGWSDASVDVTGTRKGIDNPHGGAVNTPDPTADATEAATSFSGTSYPAVEVGLVEGLPLSTGKPKSRAIGTGSSIGTWMRTPRPADTR